MIQLRNVPDDLHRELKSRAALSGMSLSNYLIAEIHKIAERLTMEQLRALLRAYPPTTLDESPADIIRAMRDAV